MFWKNWQNRKLRTKNIMNWEIVSLFLPPELDPDKFIKYIQLRINPTIITIGSLNVPAIIPALLGSDIIAILSRTINPNIKIETYSFILVF